MTAARNLAGFAAKTAANGALTGSLIGNVTGNLTGNVTFGDASTQTTAGKMVKISSGSWSSATSVNFYNGAYGAYRNVFVQYSITQTGTNAITYSLGSNRSTWTGNYIEGSGSLTWNTQTNPSSYMGTMYYYAKASNANAVQHASLRGSMNIHMAKSDSTTGNGLHFDYYNIERSGSPGVAVYVNKGHYILGPNDGTAGAAWEAGQTLSIGYFFSEATSGNYEIWGVAA